MKIVTLEELETAVPIFLGRVLQNNIVQASIYQNQSNTGARYHDIARLSNWSVKNGNSFVLKPLKNNDIRIFSKDDIDVMLMQQIVHGYDMYSRSSYKSGVEVFNAMFPIRKMQVKGKPIKTHIFRHIKAKRLKRDGYSDNEIRLYLGERSQRSANDYIYSTIYSNWVQV